MRAVKVKSNTDRKHIRDDGCQWAQRCAECPWPDCVIKVKRRPYWSPEAVELRKLMVVCLRDQLKLTAVEVAAMLRFSQRSVYAHSSASTKEERARRNGEISAAHKLHELTAKQLAEKFGVRERTIRYVIEKSNSQLELSRKKLLT